MCNAGVYKDGDFCTALEVIKVFNELAGNPKYQAKQFVVYLNDIDAGRIENFKRSYSSDRTKQKLTCLDIKHGC